MKKKILRPYKKTRDALHKLPNPLSLTDRFFSPFLCLNRKPYDLRIVNIFFFFFQVFLCILSFALCVSGFVISFTAELNEWKYGFYLGIASCILFIVLFFNLVSFFFHQNADVMYLILSTIFLAYFVGLYFIFGKGFNISCIRYCILLVAFWSIVAVKSVFYHLISAACFAIIFGLTLTDIILAPAIVNNRASLILNMVVELNVYFWVIVFAVRIMIKQKYDERMLRKISSGIQNLNLNKKSIKKIKNKQFRILSKSEGFIREIVDQMEIYMTYLPISLRPFVEEDTTIMEQDPEYAVDRRSQSELSAIVDNKTNSKNLSNKVNVGTLSDEDDLLSKSSEKSAEYEKENHELVKREIVYMTVKISDFEKIIRRLTKDEIIVFHNHYVQKVLSVVIAEEGKLIDFDRDRMFCVWNATKESKNMKKQSSFAAFKIVDYFHKNENLKKEFSFQIPLINIKISVTAGEALIGNIGCKAIRRFNIFGDVVTLNEEMERYTKGLESPIVLSQHVVNNSVSYYFNTKIIECYEEGSDDKKRTLVYNLKGIKKFKQDKEWVKKFKQENTDENEILESAWKAYAANEISKAKENLKKYENVAKNFDETADLLVSKLNRKSSVLEVSRTLTRKARSAHRINTTISLSDRKREFVDDDEELGLIKIGSDLD